MRKSPLDTRPECRPLRIFTFDPMLSRAGDHRIRIEVPYRFHGARGGGPRGTRNGMYRYGQYTHEAVAERRMIRELLRESAKGLSLALSVLPGLE